MADDIKGTLSDIAKLQASIKSLNDQSKDLAKTDARSFIQIDRLSQSYRKLLGTMQDREKLEKEIGEALKGNQTISAETMKQYEELESLEKEQRQSVLATQTTIAKVYQDRKKLQLEQNELMEEYFRKNTLLGKVITGLTGPLAKLTAGISFGALAMKALKKEVESADLRSKLMIQSFKGLDNVDLKTAAGQVNRLNKALVDAQAEAIHFGKSADEANSTMLAFGRIVGTDNPEHLNRLTKAALAVSASLGMDTAEAVDFINTRMQKFGGTATSAIMTLDRMRKGSEELNKGFGRLVLRGDDLVRAVADITKQDTMYTVDQEYVGDVIKQNVARLTALGESYDTAYKRAKMFAEGTTDKMPEWMKITTGASILDGMSSAMSKGGGAFEKQYGQALDKAKPGLSKKIKDILSDKSITNYDKSRRIQELTAGLSVGQVAANKQLLSLYQQSGNSLSVIAQQYHIGYDEAASLVDMAKKQNEEDELNQKLQSGSADQIQEILNKKYKGLNLTKEEAEKLKGNKEQMETLIKQQEMKLTLQDDINRQAQEELNRKAQMATLQDKLNAARALAKDGTNSDLQHAAEATAKKIEAQMEALKRKDQEGEQEKATLDSVTKEIHDSAENTAKLTGRKFDEVVTRLSSIENLIKGALVAGALGLIVKKFIDPKTLIQSIAKSYLGGGDKGGGGGGAADLLKGLFKGGAKAEGTVAAGGLTAAAEATAMGGGKMAGAVESVAEKAIKPGMFGKLAGGFKKSAGLLSKLSKSPVGKLAGKVGIGKILTAAALAPAVYEAFQQGSVREGIATMLPSVMGLAGGAIGGMAGAIGGLGVASAPLGIAGGIGGGMAGEWIGNKMADMIRPAKPGPGVAEAATAVAQTPDASAQPTGTGGGQPEMTFSGPLNADGSITVRFTNFMDAFGAAVSMSKKAPRTT